VAKTRSRNYPALSLREAIERARMFYQKEGRAKVDAASAVGAWGYSSLNGASMRTLAALRQYGLLDGNNEEIRLSEGALTLLLEPEGSPDYSSALRDALASPPLFQEILAEYADGLPSDPALISYLVRKQGFGESAARSMVESLRESIELVESRTASYIARTDTPNVATNPRQTEPEKPMTQKALDQECAAPTWKTTLDLSPTSSLEFRIVGDFPGAGDLELLPQFLELARMQLLRAVAKASPEATLDSTGE
jgi:hypothetical protein